MNGCERLINLYRECKGKGSIKEYQEIKTEFCEQGAFGCPRRTHILENLKRKETLEKKRLEVEV